jgi:hypothetical protein
VICCVEAASVVVVTEDSVVELDDVEELCRTKDPVDSAAEEDCTAPCVDVRMSSSNDVLTSLTIRSVSLSTTPTEEDSRCTSSVPRRTKTSTPCPSTRRPCFDDPLTLPIPTSSSDEA